MPKVWTPEERAQYSARAKEIAAARKARLAEQKAAAATAVADRPDEDDDDETPVSSLSSEGVLSELAGLFQRAASKEQGSDKAITDALELLGSLNPLKYPDLADNPTVQAFIERVQGARMQSSDLPPGSIIGSGLTASKKPWSWGDLKKSMHVSVEEVTRRNALGEIIFPWVEYMPIKNSPVIWNGLQVYFRARQRVYVCKVFVDVFEESLTQEEFAEQHAAWLFNTPGVVARRDFFTTTAPRLKAMDMGKGEYYQPGGGQISMAPSPDLVGLGGGQGGQ